MIHFFPEDIYFEEPHEFTDPFRYTPVPAVKVAAEEVIKRIDADQNLKERFSEGKMIGILVCKTAKSLCYICAFSGNVDGKSFIEGFVPPIYDLTAQDGRYRTQETEISKLNHKIDKLLKSDILLELKEELLKAECNRDREISDLRMAMSNSKRERDNLRKASLDSATTERLIKESQHEKAEMKRLKLAWKIRIDTIRSRINELTFAADELKRQRADMSEKLQEWIFKQYIVHNALGEEASISSIFTAKKLTPPGGTGECAAPKLLEYAYRNSLTPIAMGEFWYGKSPETAVRTQGHFYPSCTSKCGPLLAFMTKGLHIRDKAECVETPHVIYEDNILIVVEKPSGMPSVPGLDGKESLTEWLGKSTDVHSVHRLDMDTSGIMLYAKTHQSAIELRRQFEEREIHKIYLARISVQNRDIPLKGKIDLPLSADYDERPRQKVDTIQGKRAITEYHILSENTDGYADIQLSPVTGRTHQLRVHCAHHLGLGCPIVGDMLYGGEGASRLFLHAKEISFKHPENGKVMHFVSTRHCFPNP